MYNYPQNKRSFQEMNVNERIADLRARMEKKGIDVYYIPNEDDHLSQEYTAEYFQCKSFISGFSGEAGCVIVTKDFAGLWTDGRYFTQAEHELEGTCVTLMRMRQEGVPDAIDFLVDNTPENGVLGFDGRVVSAAAALGLSRRIAFKKAKIETQYDLAGEVWGSERPAMPKEKLFILPKKYTGESAQERIARVREAMQARKADVMVLTALEDPCWMLNIRGNDIAHTPVAYAFAMVTMKKVSYYVNEEKLSAKVKEYLADNDVTVRPYEKLAADLGRLHGKRIWVSLNEMNADLYSHLKEDNTILNEASCVHLFRALKNSTEVKNLKNAHIKDGVAMVQFIHWVKENVSKDDMTEVSAQDYLYARRAEQKDYIEPSFGTICAYQENAAMMHYSASEENYADVHPRGVLLVDSGGTYKDGTTDITRTIALDELTETEKKYYTMVLKGHLALARAKFLYGTCGFNLDILARGPMWNMDIDYQCGTGHGVGHVLSVHEGPHGIRWGMPRKSEGERLEPGMIVTDEPGIYLPHEIGIRIENELLVVKGTKNFYGQFLEFENVTYCPYDLDAIDVKYLTDEEIDQINDYHAMVYEKLNGLLDESDREWLKKATGKIARS